MEIALASALLMCVIALFFVTTREPVKELAVEELVEHAFTPARISPLTTESGRAIPGGAYSLGIGTRSVSCNFCSVFIYLHISIIL